VLDWFLQHFRTELFKLSDTAVTPLSVCFFALTLVLTVMSAWLVKRAILHAFLTRGKDQEGLAYAVGRIGQYVVYAVGLVLALDNLGIDVAAFAAVGAVATVGIGFGMQNIAQNFISGIILLIERPVQKGDSIVVGDIVGTVLSIEMRATKVVSRDGVAIIVPNSELISARVTNQSSPTSRKRITVKIGVAYGSDVEQVRDALVGIAGTHGDVLKDPPPRVLFTDFADSALLFELKVWIGHPDVEPVVMSDLRFAIDRDFRAKHIEIPFPQRDVHVRALPGAGT
jgi:potassium efflux system protein